MLQTTNISMDLQKTLQQMVRENNFILLFVIQILCSTFSENFGTRFTVIKIIYGQKSSCKNSYLICEPSMYAMCNLNDTF